MSTFMSRSSLCYIQISIKTFIFHIIRGQSHRSQTILGRFKISSQTNIIGAGTARTEIPDISCQTQQAGISQNKDRFCQGDREDLNQISYMFPPSPGLSFLCFPTQRLYFKFIYHLCATNLLKIKQCGKGIPSSQLNNQHILFINIYSLHRAAQRRN